MVNTGVCQITSHLRKISILKQVILGQLTLNVNNIVPMRPAHVGWDLHINVKKYR